MSTLFAINFRREAYLKAVKRARRRVMALGIWVAYFGVLLILVGLYALNAMALSNHLRQIERQTTRAKQAQDTAGSWKVGDAELAQVERYVENPRGWHDRLTRLGEILPANVKLSSVAVNPQNVSGTQDENKLVIVGELRPSPGQDRMQGVMKIVNTIHEDSLFKRRYQTVKLASTRVSETGGGAAEFVIECR
jgi:hypothetical protein